MKAIPEPESDPVSSAVKPYESKQVEPIVKVPGVTTTFAFTVTSFLVLSDPGWATKADIGGVPSTVKRTTTSAATLPATSVAPVHAAITTPSGPPVMVSVAAVATPDRASVVVQLAAGTWPRR